MCNKNGMPAIHELLAEATACHQAGQLPTLEAGNVFANGVDLVNAGTACQAQAGDPLLFLQGDTRTRGG